MRRKARRLYRRFAAARRGMAAIEFAMILPILMVLFLGTFDGGRAIAIYMKVRSATYALDAITNQYTTISSTVMSSILCAITQMMAPYSSTPAVITISQITISGSGVPTVSWSASQGGTARTVGSSITIPTALKVDNSYLIFAEVSYTFTPMYGYFSAGAINFSDNLYVTPRSSTCIVYTPQTGTTC
ncbi:MAG: TadE/TadG family type IV pilus assembly protein [Xanthobacteraceae bacterium]